MGILLVQQMTEIKAAIERGELVPVGSFSSLQEANEYALVVLAMNLDCWLHMEPDAQDLLLYAQSAYSVAIKEEFALYAAEQALPPPPKVHIPIHRSGIELLILWGLTLVLIFQNQTTALKERYLSSSIGLFEGGEWWRPFTSLFLHGDFNHLLGNLVVGGIFCVLVAFTVGPVLGWFLILASGTLGNIATSWFYYPESHLALGASTATFGALGIVVGTSAFYAWHGRSIRKLGGAILPLIAGSVVLSWWGSGAGRTNVDVLAHVNGFVLGAVLGVIAVALRPLKRVDEAKP